jgi:hypothetical protein
MASATRFASLRLLRGQAGQREDLPPQELPLVYGQAEIAFLDAVRGGKPTPHIRQVRAMDDAELMRLTHRLQRLRSECGCKVGAWSMTAAFIAAPVVAAIHGASGPVGVLVLALLSLASVIGAAAAGKVITIVVYRLRWRIERNRTIRQLAQERTDQHVILR